MDMYSKMDGTAPVSTALDGVWEIRRKGRIDEQLNDKRRKNRENKEEEEFEDGLVPREQETITAEETEPDKDKAQNGSTDEDHSTTRKIDIII